MSQYLIKRCLLLLVTLFGICLLSFLIMTMAPGDPVAAMVMGGKGGSGGESGTTKGVGGAKDEIYEHTRKALYLDRPALLNTHPNTRRSVALEKTKKITTGSDYARTSAQGEIKGEIGTAALDVFVEQAAVNVEIAQAAIAARAAVTKDLDALAAKKDAARDEDLTTILRPLEQELAYRGPRITRRMSVAEKATAWAQFLRDREAEPWIGVTTLLDTLEAIVPADKGGPATKGTPVERSKAWSEWLEKNRAFYSTESCEKATAAYMDASDADLPARLADLVKIGGAATPALVEVIESTLGARQQRAAAAFSLVAHQPWDLAPKASDFEKEYVLKKDKGELRGVTKEEYVAEGIADDRSRQLRNIRRWWFRSEEQYVDFSAPRQLGRAFTQTQFGNWFRGLAGGLDLGTSYYYKQDVSKLIWDRLPITASLNFLSLLLTYVIAIPLGVFSATHPRSILDRFATVGLFVLYSLPSFWVGSILILLFTGKPGLNWFPSHGMESMEAGSLSDFRWLVDHLWHMTLPVVCLTYGGIAYISRMMRAGMLETLRQDFIRTARAKGLPEKVVVFKHAMRNSLIPILTILAYLLPFMFGGSIIIEEIFSIEGLGKLMFEAILHKDYPLIMAEVFISGLLTLFGMLLADVSYAIVDPRIELK